MTKRIRTAPVIAMTTFLPITLVQMAIKRLLATACCCLSADSVILRLLNSLRGRRSAEFSAAVSLKIGLSQAPKSTISLYSGGLPFETQGKQVVPVYIHADSDYFQAGSK